MKRLIQYAKRVICPALFLILAFLLFDLCCPVDLHAVKETSCVVRSADGSWLYARTNTEQKWRFEADLKKIDPHFIRMLLSYEDKRFYIHYGFDPLAMSRALWQLVRNGRVLSGGSTITMQLARLLHPRDRTISAKLIEIIRALQLEWHYSKEEILSAYLTLAPYGGNVEGVVAASMRYFGKEPYALSADQTALLIALPQSPERNRPDKHFEKSMRARNKVLKMAQERSLINQYEYEEALKTDPPRKLIPFPRYAAHLAQKILRIKQQKITTLDKELQIQLEHWAKSKEGMLPKDTTLALLVVRNADAAVQAYLGSHNMFSKRSPGYVDMIKAVRSPGSTLKPFIYTLGFQKHLIHPNTLILDEETRFGDYMPHNFSHRYTGEVTLKHALQHSLNIPAVKILHRIGAEEFIHAIGQYAGGVKIPKKRVSLPVALGGLGISMWQLTQLYAALANGGRAYPLHYLKEERKEKSIKKLFDAKAVKMTTSILRDTQAPKGFANVNGQIAYKTGTSYGYRDAWTLAYNKTYTVAVWVGKPNNAIQLKVTGRQVAAPLAFEIFSLLNALNPQNVWRWSADYLGNYVPEGLHYFDQKAQEKQAKLDFVYPQENTRFRSAGCSDAIVEIKVYHGKKPYYWYIDGTGREIESDRTEVVFRQGAHTINVLDSNGDRISRNIWVDKPEC